MMPQPQNYNFGSCRPQILIFLSVCRKVPSYPQTNPHPHLFIVLELIHAKNKARQTDIKPQPK